ncbi:outer membrane beta-barrel protein [Ekhidna sp.]|uniref:outer membrane beta-barrel protein n=1 Tax=Ekhidna sp. TaxID=2608089 RepID=UPI003BAC3042
MGPKNFENSIRRKFENQTGKAPKGVWDGIENSLNADLVTVYAAQHTMYKWMSVAAVFIAVLLMGVLAFPISHTSDNQSVGTSYNALLSQDWDTELFSRNGQPPTFQTGDLTFNPIVINSFSQEEEVLFDVDRSSIRNNYYTHTKAISPLKSAIETATVSEEIYPYYSVANTNRKKGLTNNTSKVWAGVEAGAGSFNADFAGTGALSNSLNPAGLASAVGSGSFVNPTTNVAQTMEEGIATSIGVDFGVSIGKKWTLESGVAYTRMDNEGAASINVLDVYTIDNNDFINGSEGIGDGVPIGANSREATIDVEKTYDHEVALNNRVQFASIPLKAGYFLVNKKLSLRVNAGFSANYLVEGNLSDPTRQILNSDDLNLYNEWSFDGIGGLELGYSIFNKFDLTIEPNYRHSITPISNSVNSPSRFVVQTGFRYTLN